MTRRQEIAAAYAADERLEAIAERFGIATSTVVRTAIREGVPLRNAPRVPGRRKKVVRAFVSGGNIDTICRAARARNARLDQLASRIMNAVAADPTLLDNILDDGVRTDG